MDIKLKPCPFCGAERDCRKGKLRSVRQKPCAFKAKKGVDGRERSRTGKPKRFYKNKIYNAVDEKHNLDKGEWTEKALDVLVEVLLENYFNE